jgi:hypothetical protein
MLCRLLNTTHRATTTPAAVRAVAASTPSHAASSSSSSSSHTTAVAAAPLWSSINNPRCMSTARKRNQQHKKVKRDMFEKKLSDTQVFKVRVQAETLNKIDPGLVTMAPLSSPDSPAALFQAKHNTGESTFVKPKNGPKW